MAHSQKGINFVSDILNFQRSVFWNQCTCVWLTGTNAGDVKCKYYDCGRVTSF